MERPPQVWPSQNGNCSASLLKPRHRYPYRTTSTWTARRSVARRSAHAALVGRRARAIQSNRTPARRPSPSASTAAREPPHDFYEEHRTHTISPQSALGLCGELRRSLAQTEILCVLLTIGYTAAAALIAGKFRPLRRSVRSGMQCMHAFSHPRHCLATAALSTRSCLLAPQLARQPFHRSAVPPFRCFRQHRRSPQMAVCIWAAPLVAIGSTAPRTASALAVAAHAAPPPRHARVAWRRS